MAVLSNTPPPPHKVWLVDANPFQLDAPPLWWQQLVFDYDKMLRVMPSQRERVYRLCRVVRREGQMGLNMMVVHDHPDTRAMIKYGLVPVATMPLWAVKSDKVLRDLRASDSWVNHGGDVNKLVDAVEAGEQAARDAQQTEQDAHLDDVSSNAYRALRFGRPEQIQLGKTDRRLHDPGDAQTDAVRSTHRVPGIEHRAPKTPLPPLPRLQNRDRVDSATPPEGTVASSPKITITDL